MVQLREPPDAGPALAQALIDYCRARLSPTAPRDCAHETGKLLKRLAGQQRYWPGEGIARCTSKTRHES